MPTRMKMHDREYPNIKCEPAVSKEDFGSDISVLTRWISCAGKFRQRFAYTGAVKNVSGLDSERWGAKNGHVGQTTKRFQGATHVSNRYWRSFPEHGKMIVVRAKTNDSRVDISIGGIFPPLRLYGGRKKKPPGRFWTARKLPRARF